MTGGLARPLGWSFLIGALLLAWPWWLAWLAARRPGWLGDVAVPGRFALRQSWLDGGRPTARDLVAWIALVTLAAILPAAPTWLAADLDAGMLWSLALALLMARVGCAHRLADAPAAGATLALLGAVVPVAVRVASLSFSDAVIAQQGGAGNWFLIREPFCVLAGAVFLATSAAVWQTSDAPDAGSSLTVAVDLGGPLVAAHAFSVLYLGGWWAFVPFLDGVPWLNTVLKTLVVFALLVWLRSSSWRWVQPAALARVLPLGGLTAALGSVLWLVLHGGVR
jgi:NADH:ubiquinone oxidoreductase subunit H